MVYNVKFEKKNFLSLKRVFEMNPDVILINATGKGLQYHGGYDNECYTIRGQTLLVRPPKDCPYLEKTITHQSKEGFWTFLIPRPLYGGVILGGTKQPNDSYRTARNEDTLAISSRAKTLFPGLFRNGVLDIISINVGFRPARNGGLRIEMEKVNDNVVIHAYGAGGMGYELSYGIGTKVKDILYSVDSLYSKL